MHQEESASNMRVLHWVVCRLADEEMLELAHV